MNAEGSLAANNLISPVTGRILAGTGAAAIAAGAGVVWYFDPAKASFLPACPLYTMTGFACPGCGMTRGFHALFHGDIATAVDFNALVPVFAVIVSYLVVYLVVYAVRGKELSTTALRPGWLFGLLGVMIIFGVLRNLPYYPFSLLFP